ncbi:MAG: OB-fold nucleic acid binding domain-containing protein [Ignavibacteriales bacterium]|nr:OB-fold nucleic acid binding domain-containing protein [Ignavibacteriales bacterium]
MKRTTTCGALRKADAGTTVVLNGWVHRKRDHGGISFVNLRDRYGVTQVVVDADAAEPRSRPSRAELKYEYCVAVEGTVRARPDVHGQSRHGHGRDRGRGLSDLQILTPLRDPALP